MSVPSQLKQQHGSNQADDKHLWMKNVVDQYKNRPDTQPFINMCLATFSSQYGVLATSQIQWLKPAHVPWPMCKCVHSQRRIVPWAQGEPERALRVSACGEQIHFRFVKSVLNLDDQLRMEAPVPLARASPRHNVRPSVQFAGYIHYSDGE